MNCENVMEYNFESLPYKGYLLFPGEHQIYFIE